MSKNFPVAPFDLDITLRDAALDPALSPAQRMVANATIGVEPNDAFYSVRELRELAEAVSNEVPGAKGRLTRTLATECDDFQRCIYYQLAGRGCVQMIDTLIWLEEILETRVIVQRDRFLDNDLPQILVNPYVAAEPDGPLVAYDDDFREGASWFLDPDLGGMLCQE